MKKVVLFSIVSAFLFIFVLSASPATAEVNSEASTYYQFSRTLTVGSAGSDVQELQKWLNRNGFMVATKGPGSLGHETRTYGAKTAAAVKKFQETYRAQILSDAGLSEGTGRFATSSRAFLNKAIEVNHSGVVLGAFIDNSKK